MLVYVDSETIKQIGSNLLLSSKDTHTVKSGFSIGVPPISLSMGEEHTEAIEKLNIMPETLARNIIEDMEAEGVKKIIDVMRARTNEGEMEVFPGDAYLVRGVLDFGDAVADQKDFDPLTPPELDIKVYRLHGEDVIVAKLFESPFFLPVYFPVNSKDHVPYAHHQAVTILGVIKWIPAYKPGSGAPVEMCIRVGSMWIN